MNELLEEVRGCDICKNYITPRPVVFANEKSKILIIGQAPGTRVHASGIPWDDASGKQLRKWLDVTNDQFYNVDNFGIIPMGFCYPGKGKTGDLPPRKECAPQWHKLLLNKMPNVELVLLIGMYAQKYYLKDKAEKTLTNTVSNYQKYLPNYFVLPHPSPRNRFWLTKNPWFEKNILPELKNQINKLL
ncbi:uracil-DNA glycosylase family protein [Tenacibaculum sp. E3R01]|uniref:uracil-DNA glycosylase family protein n=1 Tax=unclassified Tenacibaculum TaxID=2635139 RepID=UPI00089B1B50|nr:MULTISPECIES: uracil-DNA glycosylase family protein [unclassified Tenacibaculum]RBW59177.1 uracil-DNA glycosylase family protein [Tenacibaculum sp. E3R01]SEE11640.1 uracil-DNA glycosylase, family 4 [Tenacibaculum sp. MAR_2010_89]